jgi:hypothetical protein
VAQRPFLGAAAFVFGWRSARFWVAQRFSAAVTLHCFENGFSR